MVGQADFDCPWRKLFVGLKRWAAAHGLFVFYFFLALWGVGFGNLLRLFFAELFCPVLSEILPDDRLRLPEKLPYRYVKGFLRCHIQETPPERMREMHIRSDGAFCFFILSDVLPPLQSPCCGKLLQEQYPQASAERQFRQEAPACPENSECLPRAVCRFPPLP